MKKTILTLAVFAQCATAQLIVIPYAPAPVVGPSEVRTLFTGQTVLPTRVPTLGEFLHRGHVQEDQAPVYAPLPIYQPCIHMPTYYAPSYYPMYSYPTMYYGGY